MASTYSTNLALELIGNNDQAGTWGNTTNNNLGTLIEQAISGYVTQAITDGADTVITIPNGASGVARNMTLELTGALTGARNLIVPANRKLYFIFNNTTGSQSVTVKVSGQTGVSVPNGQKMVLVCNGTDVVTAVTYAASMSVGSLTLPNGAANGVAYLNASKVVTAGSTLTFDGVQTLSVFGTGNSVLHLEGSTTNNGVMRFRNGTTGALSGLIGNNSKDLVFESNGAVEQMRLTSAGNFGIGTASPANYSNYRNLAINGTTGGNIDMLSNGTKVGNLFNDGTNFYAYNVIAGSMVFGTNNTERARFDSNGNLGIGTSGIAARGNLDVSSGNLSGSQTRSIHLGYSASDFYGFRVTNINDAGSTFAGTFRVQRGTGSAWSDDVVVSDSGNVGIGTAIPVYRLDLQGASGVGMQIYETSTGNNNRLIITQVGTVATYNNTYSNGFGHHAWQTGGAERMRLDDSGNLGIGTAGPLFRLHVAQTSSAVVFGQDGTTPTVIGTNAAGTGSGALSLRGFPLIFTGNGAGGAEQMRLDSSGNLGLGVTLSAWRSGARALQSGAAGYVALWEQANGSANLAFSAYESAPNTFAYRTTGDAPTLYSQVTGVHTWSNAVAGTANNTFSFTERMRLDASGNLGIGTASPATKLQVKSSAAQAVNIEGTSARGSGNIFAAFLDPTGRKGYFGYGTSVDDGLLIVNEMNAYMAFHTNAVERMRLDSSGNIVAGASAALATNATNGFLYVPTCAGTPTGTPTAITGMAPIVVNTTNNKLYFYSGGAWRDAGP